MSRDRQLARLPRASDLLPEAGLLFFACPKKSNQKKGPPGWRAFRAAPSRCAVGLRGFSTGHPCPVEKLAASMRPPCGLSSTRPPRHTGTPEGQSHIKSRTRPGAVGPGRSFVGAHPVRERRLPGGLLGRGRAQGALLQGVTQVWGWRINLAGRLFVGAHPVRDKPTQRYTHA